MITKHYSHAVKDKIFLIVSGNPAGFEIQVGKLVNPDAFLKDHTILIEKNRPNLLWDLLHDAAGIPYPQLEPLKEASPIEEKCLPVEVGMQSFEQELRKLSAKEIIEKIKNEKNIVVTNCLKSKKAIVAKALKIYSGN